MSSKAPSVAISVLHWGDPADTERALKSLEQQSYTPKHIFLVDQLGTYGGYLPKLAERLVPARNLGFSGGNNLVIEHALALGYAYVLMFNNDASGQPDFLSLLVEALESSPGAAAAGPTIVYADSPTVVWYGGGELLQHQGRVRHTGTGMQHSVTAEHSVAPVPVSFITGCSLLMRTEVIKEIGPLDDRYFVYWEDADWGARAAAAGHQLLYVPRSTVAHGVSAALGVNSPTYLYYNLRNNLLFVRQFVEPQWRPLAWLAVFEKVSKELIKLVLRYRKNYGTYLQMIGRAFYDNARRKYGPLN